MTARWRLWFTAAAALAITTPAWPQGIVYQTGADIRDACRATDAAAKQRCDGFLGEMFNMLETLVPLCAPPSAAPDLRGAFLRYALAHPEYLLDGRATAVTNAFSEAFGCQ